jgi:3-keto-disaccharide hydrolase
MEKSKKALVVGLVLACFSAASGTAQQLAGVEIDGNGHAGKTQLLTLPLDSLDGLEVHSIREDGIDPVKTKAEVATYRGRRALRIVNEDGLTGTSTSAGAQAIAIVKTSEFKDGTLEVDVAALPREGAPPTTRGFVGIAFHVQDHHCFQFESFYLRMINGRSHDQLERNHATQYVSEPEFRWQRLRRDNPGVYESYVDLELGTWTRIKIVVAGTTAQMFIDGAAQPCLIVNDLKLGEAHGQVALWTGSNTQAYFSNLTVK